MNVSCENCSESFETDEMPRRGPVCFRCHLRGIRIGFTYGKEQFSGPTIGERQRKAVADAEKSGRKIEPVGTRWV